MQAEVGVIMGSTSDWSTMEHACLFLEQCEVPFEKKVISAHRAPQLMMTYAMEAKSRGIKVIIAGAGGAAHLPGMVAANTTLPVIGVPIQSKALNGMDSLLSIVQMPAGVPVATVAIGSAGAKNAAILATQILAIDNMQLAQKLSAVREEARILSEQSSKELTSFEK